MIKIGILGCGKIAQVRHIPEYAANPDCELVGFFNPTKSRAEDMAAKYGGRVNVVEIESDDYPKELKKADVKSVLIIPAGFTENVKNSECAEVKSVQRLTSLASMSNLNAGSQTAVEYLTAAVKEVVFGSKVSANKLTNSEVEFLNQPLVLKETTVVTDKSYDVQASVIVQMCSVQAMLVPIVLFVLVMMSSNMILNAISTEKVDKTLETLLSTPVSRISVITAIDDNMRIRSV